MVFLIRMILKGMLQFEKYEHRPFLQTSVNEYEYASSNIEKIMTSYTGNARLCFKVV